jgi:hypothetical protein
MKKLRRSIAHWSMPVRQFLGNLQMRGAFLAAFTVENDDDNQKIIPPMAIDNCAANLTVACSTC